jgi:hypothetical protein
VHDRGEEMLYRFSYIDPSVPTDEADVPQAIANL